MAARDQQQLASKEAGLFRQVVKFYESKQYKKGIKAADQVFDTLTCFNASTCICKYSCDAKCCPPL